MGITFDQFINWCFYGLFGLVGFLIWQGGSFFVTSVTTYFSSFLEELKKLRVEISELNTKITTIISDQGWMGKSIEKHDDLFKDIFTRLNKIEKQQAVLGVDFGHQLSR